MDILNGTLLPVFSLALLLGGTAALFFSPPRKHSATISRILGSHDRSSIRDDGASSQISTGKPSHQDSDSSDQDNFFESEADSDFSDDDHDEQNKELKQQRKQRLKQLGWFGYFKSFLDLIPDIWPSGNKLLQFEMAAMVGLKLVDSLLNVLVHHQQSKAINLLWDAAFRSGHDKSARSPDFLRTGKSESSLLPYKEVGLWLFYRCLGPNGIISAFMRPLGTRVEWHFLNATQRAAFNHVMALSMDYHDDKASYDTLSSMEYSQSIYSVGEQLVFEVAPIFIDLAIAYVYFFYRFDWEIALLAIIVTIAYTFLTYKSSRWIQDQRKAEMRAHKRFRRVNNESVTNWKTVISFNGTSHQRHLFTRALGKKGKAYQQSDDTFMVQQELLSLFTHVGLAAACFLVVHRILNGLNSAGEFLLIVQHWQSIQRPLKYLVSSYKYIRRDLTGLERFFNLMLTRQTVKDKPEAPPLRFDHGQVEFQNVSFFYKPDKVILKDLNFIAEAGKTVALVGETGGGKSTTIKLLPRFYDVCSGAIKIDGQDIRDISQESLRAAIGIVPQTASLFNKSIMDNIRYGRLDATDEEVHDACRAAAVHDKIMTFTKGYKSKVGEGGVKLSGGELQRISIARTILKQPKIVLLDEATSAVDTETEKKIQDGLSKLCAGRTTFVVAHRLSTIMHADLILVIADGQIAERGTHRELLELGGKYTNLVKKQSAMNADVRLSPSSSAQESELASDESEMDTGELDGGVDKKSSDADDSGIEVE